MKKIIFLFCLSLLMIQNVYAKDSIYSIHQYEEEKLTKIMDVLGRNTTIVAGEVTEKKEDEVNTKAIVIKYKKNGKKAWTYQKDMDEGNSYFVDGDNTFQLDSEENKEANGYSILVKTETEEEIKYLWIHLDLEGNVVWEKELPKEENEAITKIIKVSKPHSESFVGISTDGKSSNIFSYNAEGELEWKEHYDNVVFTDLTNYDSNNETEGYLVLQEQKEDDVLETRQLIKISKEGKLEQVVVPSLEQYSTISVTSGLNQFILYGTTEEVKVKKGKQSYFIINYNQDLEEVWETIGDVPVKQNTTPILLYDLSDGYFLLYQNGIDSSYEVIYLNTEGLVQKKVKKFMNDYYTFYDFNTLEDTLFFVGQINCPEDDNCDTDRKSLYLVSSEEKVIEVEDKDSTGILLVTGVLLLLLGGTIYLKRKRRLK